MWLLFVQKKLYLFYSYRIFLDFALFRRNGLYLSRLLVYIFLRSLFCVCMWNGFCWFSVAASTIALRLYSFTYEILVRLDTLYFLFWSRKFKKICHISDLHLEQFYRTVTYFSELKLGLKTIVLTMNVFETATHSKGSQGSW